VKFADDMEKPDPDALRMEAELRATLRPGGSTERVWHLIDFNIERERRMAERHVDLEDLEQTIHRGWRWVWLGPLQMSMSVAALVMAVFLVHELRSTPEPREPASWVAGDHDRDALSALTAVERAKLDALIEGLSSVDPAASDDAEKEIMTYGGRALPALEQVSKKQNPELYARVARLIAQLSAPAVPK